MNDETFVTYEHVSHSLAELQCAHCSQAFEEGQERLMRITVRQRGSDPSNAQLEIHCIHVEGCLAERQFAKEAQVLRQIQLPHRHRVNLTATNHEALYHTVEKHHRLLLRCVQDYDTAAMKFIPGWFSTHEKFPSYQLLLPANASVLVSKQFYTYEQFKAQFSRVYTVDVNVLELNAEKELVLSNYFEQWKRRLVQQCLQIAGNCDIQLWSHLLSLDSTNKADVRLVVWISLTDSCVRKLFEQCNSDTDFAWSQILPYNLNADPGSDSWSQALVGWQRVLNEVWRDVFETIVPETGDGKTLSATIGRVSMDFLSYTKPVLLQSGQALLINMNIQDRNELERYYILSVDGKYLWCYSGTLDDPLPLLLGDYTNIDREMERARLLHVKLDQLKKRFVCVAGQPVQPAAMKKEVKRLQPTL